MMKKDFNPFGHPVCKVEAIVKGSISRLKGQDRVFVERDKTFSICDLIPVHQKDIDGGIWKVESMILRRPDYFSLLAKEGMSLKSGYGCIITNFKGEPLMPIHWRMFESLGLNEDHFWFASREIIVVEANRFDDTVKIRHCQIVRRPEAIYLREKYLSIANGSKQPEVLKIGYHTFNGNLSKFIALELGPLANLSKAVIAALDKVHCGKCVEGNCGSHFFLERERAKN